MKLVQFPKWAGLIMATNFRSSRLTKNDIKIVRKEVFPAASKYYDLGIELGLDPDYLNTLTSKSDEENLRELLVRWLSGVDPEPTWEALCEALRNPAIKHELLADEIEGKYCNVESKFNNAQEDSSEVRPVKQSTIIEQAEEDAACILSEKDVYMSGTLSTPTNGNASTTLVQDSYQQKFARSKRSSIATCTSGNKSSLEWGSTALSEGAISRQLKDQRMLLKLSHKPGLHPSSSHPLRSQEVHHKRAQESDDDPFSNGDTTDDVLKATASALINLTNDQLKEESVTQYSQSAVRYKINRHRRLLSDQEAEKRKWSLPSPRSSSLSVPTWSTAMYQGIEYKFIGKPDQDFFCQICGEIANEPHQSNCCSSLLCRSCIPESECPICLKSGICKSYPDRRSQRRIQQMEVICPNAPHGLECQWRGELSAVAEHQLECQRETIPCPYTKIGCEAQVYRCDVKTHEEKHKQVHLDLSMKMVLSLTTAVEEMQEKFEKQNDTMDSLIKDIKELKLQINLS